jgi:hypothetical protein
MPKKKKRSMSMKGITFTENVWAKLKLTGTAALALAFILILAGCPPEGIRVHVDAVVNDFVLTSEVTWPVTGAAPQTTIPAQTQYTGTIAWQTGEGGAAGEYFAASTVYKAVVTLTAEPGYTFQGIGANVFRYYGVDGVSNEANSGTVTITFPATEDITVTATDLTSLVTKPVAGAVPQASIPEQTQYTTSITWKTGWNGAVSGNFKAFTEYKAVVTLTAKPGYTFQGIGADAFVYTGADSVSYAANSGTVTITFPATEDITVTATDLTSLVTKPVAGVFPQASIPEQTQYTASITWKTREDGAVSEYFGGFTEYKAVVTLTANWGYTFQGIIANAFFHFGANSVSSAADSGTVTVTITFPATAEPAVPLERLAAYIARLPGNTAAEPHTIKLAPVNISTGNVMQSIHWAAEHKYIKLDLSACEAANNTISGAGSYSTPGPNDMNYIKNNPYIVSVILPDSLTSIGDKAFYGCSSLTSITIPGNVTSIGYDAFDGCSRLASITIPSKVTSIGSYAFNGCSSLTSIIIESGVTSIWERAFSGCSGLTSITIPSSVTSIGSSAFYGCSSLYSITIPGSVTSIGSYAFNGCSGLYSITIPSSVTSISSYAFYGCSGLYSITIPSSVTSISSYAFDGCTSLASITIPGNVTSIGYDAFDGCNGLTSVTFAAGSNINSGNFDGSFPGDLRAKYYAPGGGPGTYGRSSGGSTWTKW